MSRGEAFCTWASDVHDGFTNRLFIRWRCFWQVGICPFLFSTSDVTTYKLISLWKIVFSPSNQVWKEITSNLLLSGPRSCYSCSGISAVCAGLLDSSRHQWSSLLCHSHLHLQFRYNYAMRVFLFCIKTVGQKIIHFSGKAVFLLLPFKIIIYVKKKKQNKALHSF